MSLQDFMRDVSAEVKRRLGTGYGVGATDILKDNDVTAHAVTIHRQDERSAPCIYIDALYTRYLAGDVDISSAAGAVIRSYREHAADPGIDSISLSADHRGIPDDIHGRLINTGMNQRLLEDIPHREFLDLSLVYMITLPQHGEMAGDILIHNGYLDIWGVDETELYDAVCRDMVDPGGVVLERMDAILGPWLGTDAGSRATGCPMYVLTNRGCRDGAIQMLNGRMLREASDIMGHGDLVILPSSIHELILLPADGDDADPDHFQELAGIVREVNDTRVERPDVLSYHVYHYSREDGSVTIAA